MNAYKQVLRDLASRLLASEDRSNFTFDNSKTSQIVLLFNSGDKLKCNDYFGGVPYNVLERRPFVLDFDEGLRDGNKNYFKNFRRKLRGVLCDHISAVEEKHKTSAYLQIDFNNFVLTKLPASNGNLTSANELLASNLQTSNSGIFKLIGFNRVQLQCRNSEYYLLESLRRSGAVLTGVTCLPDEVTVDIDYGFPVKSDGVTFPFASTIYLDSVSLRPEYWEYISWPMSSLLLIPPSHLVEMCGMNIKTCVTKRMSLNKTDVTKCLEIFLWRNASGQFCTKPSYGIKNVRVSSRRRSYTLQLGAITFLLEVCQKQVYRVIKDTGCTWLAHSGSCIASVKFPKVNDSVNTLSRNVSLICTKIARETLNGPQPLRFYDVEQFLLTPNLKLPVFCIVFQKFRSLRNPENSGFCSEDTASEMVEFEAWIKRNYLT